jgi:riboflavin synthase
VFEVDVGERTAATTTLGGARAGASVNLERALRLGDRLGGHVVTGHVDGVGRVVAVERTPNGADVTIEAPPSTAGHLAPRGSIAVDGVSLTVAAVDGARFTVSLIPETLARTAAGDYRPGTPVNIETDVLAKYQESVVRSRGGRHDDAEDAAGRGGLTLERLKELGFTE